MRDVSLPVGAEQRGDEGTIGGKSSKKQTPEGGGSRPAERIFPVSCGDGGGQEMEQDGVDTAAPQDAGKSILDAGRAADGCGLAGNWVIWNFSCHLTPKHSFSSIVSLEILSRCISIVFLRRIPSSLPPALV